jgi:microcystin-dependent protein
MVTTCVSGMMARQHSKSLAETLETRPINACVNYIIKLNDSTPVLVGSIIDYAKNNSAQVTPGNHHWLPCDGSQYPIERYQALAKATRGRYSTTPNRVGVPQLKGQFLRCIDDGAGRDPDARSREAAPDGTNGDNVGTLQPYATSSRGWNVTIPHFHNGNTHRYYTIKAGGHDNLKGRDFISTTKFEGGLAESRPINVMVDHYILAEETSDPSEFPLGGVIAIPGSGVPDSKYWTLADGRSIQRSANPELYAVLQNAWGGAADGSTFNLPDLRDMFLRGTDVSPKGVEDQYGDPDRWTRTASAPGGVTAGTGSKQAPETGNPWHPFRIDAVHPTASDWNATGTGRKTSRFNSGETTYTVIGGDEETAPVSLAAYFYIKTANSQSTSHSQQGRL